MSRLNVAPRSLGLRALTFRLLPALFALLAICLVGVRGPVADPQVHRDSTPQLVAGSQHATAAVTSERFEPQVRRDAEPLDATQLAPPLLAAAARPWRLPARSFAELGPGPGYREPRERGVSRFRRRLPRLGSEEPPWS